MTKLTLKCGDIEVEYEGPEEFLKAELPELIKAIAQLRQAPAERADPAEIPAGLLDGVSPMSVSTIAQKLGVKNGPDLIVAAAMSFAAAGSKSITKKQLRERIKDATSFFKASYGNNFDNYVARLVKKGRLNHGGGDSYALPTTELTKLGSLKT